MIGLDGLDPPEVKGRALGQLAGIAPAAAEPHAADEQVEEAAQVPECIAEVPAGRSSDGSDRREGVSGRYRYANRARVHEPLAETDAAVPLGPQPGGGKRVRPARLGELAILVSQRVCDGLAMAARPDREGSSAVASRTTVSWGRLSISFRPTRA